MKPPPGSPFLNCVWRWVYRTLLTLIIGNLIAWLAADALVVRSDLAHADALVVLAGSSTYGERTRQAAQLFKEARAPRVILTNDNQKSGWSAEKESNPLFVERAADELTFRGVPEDKIEIVPGIVSSTYDEAVRLREYALKKNLRSILVVTSAYQSRRALWIFRRTFRDSGIEIGLSPVEPGEQSPGATSWWRYRLGWEMVPGEYLKIVYYRLRY